VAYVHLVGSSGWLQIKEKDMMVRKMMEMIMVKKMKEYILIVKE
jgi:hypothetical protein